MRKSIPFKPKSMSLQDAAIYTGISVRRLTDLIAQRELTKLRNGTRILLLTSELDELVESLIVAEEGCSD